MEEEIDEPEHLPTIQPSVKKGRHRKRQLLQAILQQMEFYFSDSNLTKDRFLANLIRDDPYVDVSIFLKFNKIRSLTNNTNDIVRALKKSTFLSLSDDKTKVRRTTPVQQKDNIDDCTIYVERIPTDITHDGLSKIFSQFGNVQYISIPKYKHNKMIKGFAFVEFDTPEAAQKTLDHFASIGCKLPSQMPPDKLYSIVTYNPNEENASSEKTETNSVKLTEQSEIISEKEINNDPIVQPDTNTMESESNNVNSNDDKQSVTELDVKKSRKRGISETAELTDENRDKEAKKLKSDDLDATKENTETETETIEENPAENGGAETADQNNEKRRRRRKRKDRNEIDIKEMGLQVLSKREWKRLRNKYLDLQRAKMKSLKLQLYRARFSNPNSQQLQTNQQCNGNDQPDSTGDKSNGEKSKTEKIFTIDEGTVVHMQFPDPCVDLKNFKAELKTFSNDVKFIDISEGSFEAYVRFANREAAKKFSECSYPATMQILEGDAHREYFEKAQKDRINKFQRTATKPKKRGRDKLLKKAEKELGIHIRFEDAE